MAEGLSVGHGRNCPPPQKARNTDVSISRCLRVHPRFHARYHAKARTYFYRIHTAHNPPSIFEQDRMWHCKLKPPQFLDLERMKVDAHPSMDNPRCNAATLAAVRSVPLLPRVTWATHITQSGTRRAQRRRRPGRSPAPTTSKTFAARNARRPAPYAHWSSRSGHVPHGHRFRTVRGPGSVPSPDPKLT